MLHNVRIPVLLFLFFIFYFRLFVFIDLDFFGRVRRTTLFGFLLVRLFSNWVKLCLNWLKLNHLLLIISLLRGKWLLLGARWSSPGRFLLSLYIILIAGLQRWIFVLLFILGLRILFSALGRLEYARNNQILARLWSVAAWTSDHFLWFIFFVRLIIIGSST